MGGFTSLSIGVSGLKASQNAINTTSHNIANANTPGYVRQQVHFTDTNYLNLGVGALNTNQVGIGVSYAEVRHIRDTLLDKAFRQEQGRQAFYENQYKAIMEIEGLFGEIEGVQFQNTLTALRESISEIAKNSSTTENRGALVESAVTFIKRANTIYKGLAEYQNNLNTQVSNMVKRINELGDTIFEMNQKISAIEAGGIEAANDYRDIRDNALDELSGLMNIQYNENSMGVVTVKAEGVKFVSETNVTYMGVKALNTLEDSMLVSPVWPSMEDNAVFSLSEKVSTANNTDIGALKGLLLARGDTTANYTDIPDFKDYPGGKADPDYLKDLKTYENRIENSTIKTVMAEFDQLINAIVSDINDILCPNKSAASAGITAGMTLNSTDGTKRLVIEADGTVKNTAGQVIGKLDDLQVLDTENAGYAKDLKTQGVELFTRNDVERYTEYEMPDGSKIKVFNATNDYGKESLYTLGNMSINEDVLQDASLIPLSSKNGEEDQKRAEALVDLWNNGDLRLRPSNNTQRSYMEYYTEFIGQIGNAGDLYENMVKQQDNLTNGIDEARQRITGVSTDEELANLVKFQAAYNASSRYINVVNSMLEHLVTRL